MMAFSPQSVSRIGADPMGIVHIFKVTSILIGIAFLTMFAGCSSGYCMDDLSGTWVGDDHTINSRGKSLTQKTIVLNVDDDGLIDGSATWTMVTGEGGHDGNTKARTDSEDVIGAFDPQDGTFFLVETEEAGFWQGRMVSPELIRCFLVQPGEKPVSSFAELRKQ